MTRVRSCLFCILIPLIVASSTPAGEGYSEQKCDRKARQRCFARYGAQPCKRSSRALSLIDDSTESVNREPKAIADLLDFPRYVCGRINGALGNAGRRDRVRRLYAHLPRPSVRGDEAATFGYPRVRVF